MTDLTFFYQIIYLKQKEKNAIQKYQNKLKIIKPSENNHKFILHIEQRHQNSLKAYVLLFSIMYVCT